MSGDPLFSIRNHFYLANYQRVTTDCGKIRHVTTLSPAQQNERNEIEYRAYVGQGLYDQVIQQIPDGPATPHGLRAIRLLAEYLRSQSPPFSCRNPTQAIEELNTFLPDTACMTTRVVGATIFLHEQDFAEALKAVKPESGPSHLERLSVHIQILLAMNRPDLANVQLQTMLKADDDAVITQLASAQVNLAPVTGKASAALDIYTELQDKFGLTPVIGNGLAAAHLQMRASDQAEKILLELPQTADTLINLIVCMLQLNRPAASIATNLSKLQSMAPRHPLVRRLTLLEEKFDEAAIALKAG